MIKKYIHYGNKTIYAIYYRVNGTVYYNLDFCSKVKLIIYK